MQKVQGIRFIRYLTAEAFLDANAELLPVVHASRAFAKLRELNADVRRHAANKQERRFSRLSETEHYQALRKTLVEDHLARIVAVAQSALVTDEELRVFTMPRGNPPAPGS